MQEVCQSTLSRSWKELRPECVLTTDGWYPSFDKECVHYSIAISRTRGFEGVAVHDTTELHGSYSEKLPSVELAQLTLWWEKRLFT